ncbi:MAG: YaeQ family protein [Tahibacter sp.]
MALKATVYKAELQISDMDRHYYASHSLTLARHPSETDERMMVRLLAFGLHAHERLAFGKGISDSDEAALSQRDLTGAIELWIDLGQPDEANIRRACGRADNVVIYTYSGRSAQIWWDRVSASLARSRNLRVVDIAEASVQALGALAQRQMQLQLIVQDGQVTLMDAQNSVDVVLNPRSRD